MQRLQQGRVAEDGCLGVGSWGDQVLPSYNRLGSC